MKTLVALGAAVLLSTGVLAGGAACADPWPKSSGPSWSHSGGFSQQRSFQSGPHSFGSWPQPHSSGTWPQNHPSGPWAGDHRDHRHHNWQGGRPFFGWGPGPEYDDDYFYGDGYYPLYPDDQYYPPYAGDGGYQAHVRWCETHYRTYNPGTDTFFVRRGVPARCIAPFDRP